MRPAPLACLVVVALAGCGGDGRGATATTTPGTGPARGAQLPAEELEPSYTTGMPRHPEGPPGAPSVLVQSGCLACHQIGASGNSGPGNNLSAIGSRRSANQIRRAIVSGATPPMPAFRQFAPGRLDALVAYLAGLRDRDCPGTSDCG